MWQNFNKINLYIAACLLLLATMSLNARDFKKHPLTVIADESYAPYSSELKDKTPSGYLVDFWKLWSKVNQIPVKMTLGQFPGIIEDLKNKKYDLYAGLFENEERAKWALFSSPVHFVKSGFYTKSTSTLLNSKKFNQNHSVGVIKGSYQELYVKLNFPKLQIHLYDHGEDATQDLFAGKIDLIYPEIPHQDWLLGKMGLTGTLQLQKKYQIGNALRAVIPKWNASILKIINQGIKQIPVAKLQALEKKWFPNSHPFFNQIPKLKNSPFSRNQIDWLIEHKSILLGVDATSEPFEFLDKDKKFKGISSDYLKIINQKLKLNLTQHPNHKWSDLIKMIQLGHIDMLSAIVKTKQRAKYINFSKPYLTYPVVIATRKDKLFIQGLNDLRQHTVGIVRDYFIEEILEEKHPLLKLIPFNSVEEGIHAVNENKVDAFLGNIAVVTHILNKNNDNLVRITARIPYDLELSIGLRKGLEHMIPIINKVIDGITPEQKASISNRWLALNLDMGTSIQTFLLWISPVLLILALIIFYIYRANRQLYLEASERKKVEKSLVNARIIAEKANKSKDEFLANVSHEIRTPMNAIVGMSHLLSHTALNNNQREYLLTLKSSADSLLTLIDEILDISKIESGKMQLEHIPFSLIDIFKDIENQSTIKNFSKNVELIFNLAPEIPAEIIGDPLRLKQIILNLLSNAIKFTERGKIVISAKVLDVEIDEVTLQFCVEDTGIGLSQEQMSKIFQTYSQADSSTTRKFGGTGLGLSICENLCEMMNGKIWVESKLDVGSEFYFTALFSLRKPLQEKNDTIEHLKKSNNHLISTLAGKKILLVDDNEINLTIAFKILSKMGMKITSAKDGKQAIRAIKARKFDAVLMDIQMPEMDGYTATKEIRKLPKFKSLPIIAMSANVFPSDITKSLASGMNAHLCKPLNVDDLLQTLHKFIYAENHL